MAETPSDPVRARLPVLPSAAFVLVWCSGYIAGPISVGAIDPFTVLALRFAFAAAVAAVVARVLRGPMRISRPVLTRIAIVGLLMNAAQFGLMYVAFAAGFGATLAALMHSLSPLLTAILAGLILGERLDRVQTVGFLIGVGGVLIVLGPEVDEAGGPLAVTLAGLSVVCLSLGTLGQRWYAPDLDRPAPDPWWAASVQLGVSVLPMALLGLAVEGLDAVHDPVVGATSVAWMAVVNSVAGLMLLTLLVRRGGAGASASLFFLCPPVTAVMAWFALGERLDTRELVGLLVAMIGVGAATRVRTTVAT